jgi:hypothetical protein
VKRQHGFFAGNARIAVLPAATGAELGASNGGPREWEESLMNPIWWPASKVALTGKIPDWQTAAVYSCAARWEENPVGEFLGQVSSPAGC